MLWGACAVYTLTYCYLTGYDRDPSSVKTYAGVPGWVLFGIFLPWGLANVVAWWFSFRFMTDDDLGTDPDARDGGVGDGAFSRGDDSRSTTSGETSDAG